jgi:hypothetical protein
MTSPVVIRGAEQWSRWSNLNYRTLLTSEGSEGASRLPVRGNWLLPVLKYGVIVLALCLLLSDSFHLAFARNTSRDAGAQMKPVHHASIMHGPAHARIANTKRHSGV